MADTTWKQFSLAALLFYGVLSFLFHPFVADDAYIVGRYALNAVNGDGLVYNPGERISALTSPLHAMTLTLLALVFADPVDAYRFGAPFLPLVGWAGAIRIYRPAWREIAIVSVFALASPFMALWADGGLETPILSAVLTLFAAVLFRCARRDALSGRDMMALGTLAALAFLTRFDSVLVTLPPMLTVALVEWRRGTLWAAGGLSLSIAASWLVFAYLYYGDVLPTSAYLKMSVEARVPVDSVGATVNMLLVSGTLTAVLLVIGSRERNGKTASPLEQAIRRGTALATAGFTAYLIKTGGVHMMFAYRMFVPVLFILGMIVAANMGRRRTLAFLGIQGAVQVAVASAVLFVGMNVVILRDFGRLGRTDPEYRATTPAQYGNLVATLRRDSADLVSHWDAQGLDRVPQIYLHTGGMGYWLPGFYVFEALVSYRHDCYPGTRRALKSASYVQDLDTVTSRRVRATYLLDRGPSDYDEISETTIDMDMPWTILYRFARPADNVILPATIGGLCDLDSETTISGG